MSSIPPVFSIIITPPPAIDKNAELRAKIETFMKSFDALTDESNWKAIVAQGEEALNAAETLEQPITEAKIHAHLTSINYYLGNYDLALMHANRCDELSAHFDDPVLFIRSLQFKSAVYRAFGRQEKSPQAATESFKKAVDIAVDAVALYKNKKVNDPILEGKIYFNMGAAYADSEGKVGNNQKAAACYTKALECFQGRSHKDFIRTSLRYGRISLFEKNYNECEKILKKVHQEFSRAQFSTDRLQMHTYYLEAQLRFSKNNLSDALKSAIRARDFSNKLQAKEDGKRINALIQALDALIIETA